ncbi:acyltransferase [Paraburkholderia sp. CNPSo 3272]|uniref:acyltransferase family protein n=1 Tax=Paraburkholderia sp. CNPSo 3272 TaxID=2940931 RepID=UPI0020B8DCFF|nr:acyltransferase [Paraburkholderia sp. CNPSo 3272]MCP3726162.1 acyltransferase [Paraburkholderia sp. CNPSo 3272]
MEFRYNGGHRHRWSILRWPVKAPRIPQCVGPFRIWYHLAILLFHVISAMPQAATFSTTPGQSLRLADILVRGSNNFDLVRLIASLAVIFGHSFYLFPTGGYQEPVTMLVERNFSGTLSVGTFFFISGILVTQSFDRNRSPFRFALMRLARILPGLFVCIAVLSFIIGPAVSILPLSEYFKQQSVYCYLGQNSTLIWVFPSLRSCNLLPGVFNSNHLPSAPAGSLWTLGPEVACYTYVLAAGCLGFLRTPIRLGLSIAAILVLHAVVPRAVPYFSDDHYTDALKVGLFFLAGVAAYAVRDLLVIRGRYTVLLVIAAAILQGTRVQEYALYVALFYLVLVVAASPTLRRVVLPGDYSFGVYIYGWPIQQSLNHFARTITSYPSNLVSLPLALLAGYISWTLVERPALNAVHRLVQRNRLATNPAYTQSKLMRER